MTYKPCLATDADLDRLSYPVFILNKIDGVRMEIHNGEAVGRSLKSFKNKKMTTFYSDEKFSGLIGELAYGDITGSSLCRDTTSVVNTINSEEIPVLYCFDYITDDTRHLSYKERHDLVINTVTELWSTYSIEFVGYQIAHNRDQVEQLYQTALDYGYEGVIIRDPNGTHKDGRATVKEGSYLRMKPSADAEAIVLCLEEAMENQNEAKVNELGRTERSSHQENKVGKGMCGMLVCRDLVSGQEINVGAGKMTHEERTMYWENPEKIVGTVIKYRSMMVGVKDKPRFARFISADFITERATEDMSN